MVVELKSILGGATTVGGSANVSYLGYDVLDTSTSRVAIVIRPGIVSREPETFGRTDRVTFTFRCEAFVKDSGDPQLGFSDQWQLIDGVMDAMSASAAQTLNATCTDAICRRAEPDTSAWIVNGQLYERIIFTVEGLVCPYES